MISFIVAFVILIVGYIFYSNRVEKVFGPDNRVTPAVKHKDGVDYVVMPRWKIFLIQFLNIAGLGPIFGALQGAMFGPVVFLWIAFGTIFAGGVHDYFSGMLSERNDGKMLAEVVGNELGDKMRLIMRIFTVLLLLMIGVVFTIGPAGLIVSLLRDVRPTSIFANQRLWLFIIFAYYFFSTFVPIDKIIGKAYPVFGICLILMAIGVFIGIISHSEYQIPEIWNYFYNMNPQKLPIWPFMFITVACGAISGFHSTQSPIMARCIESEKDGRKIFYGAMVAEGMLALIWAAAGCSIYEKTGGLMTGLSDALSQGQSTAIYDVCIKTMGKGGIILGALGVIICPITSGDTAFRGARLTIADILKINQKDARKRLMIVVPLFILAIVIAELDYSVIWRYFSWSNQTLATIVLWSITIYLYNNRKKYKITLVPAIFMSIIIVTYFLIAPECLGILHIPYIIAIVVGILIALVLYLIFLVYRLNHIRKRELFKSSSWKDLLDKDK